MDNKNNLYKDMQLQDDNYYYGCNSNGDMISISKSDMHKLVKLVQNKMRGKGINYSFSLILGKLTDTNILEACQPYGLKKSKKGIN